MPELPDLTIFAQNLRKLLLDKAILTAAIFNYAKVNATPDAFSQALVGSRFSSIDREGKEMLFRLDNGNSFSVHLMLQGVFTCLPTDNVFSINSKIIAIGLAQGDSLVVSDAKHMCRVTLNPVLSSVPDALSDAFTFDYLQKMAGRKATMNVKTFLIDQKIVRGIGNAYVDEILWQANISPKSTVGKIPPEYLFRLYESIRTVLQDAIAQIQRISPQRISGEERSFLGVHKPGKKTTDDGDPIHYEQLNQKGTYYTDRQILFL